jgi:hypothetical protein
MKSIPEKQIAIISSEDARVLELLLEEYSMVGESMQRHKMCHRILPHLAALISGQKKAIMLKP